MGNVRTPKPHYFQNGVVEFYVKDGVIFYKTMLWLKDGSTQFKFASGIYNELTTPVSDLANRALQSFSSVGVIEN